MAKRKKKRRTAKRKSAHNPKKRVRRKKRKNPVRARARAANPKRRRARRAKRKNPARARAANPKRRKTRRKKRKNPSVSTRARAANPRRGKRRSKRRKKKNPDLPIWAKAGIAVALGVLGYVAVAGGSFAATQRLDTTMASYERNMWIAGGLAIVGGIVLAVKGHPMYGTALAVGGAAATAGPRAANLFGKVAYVQPKQNAMAGVVAPRQLGMGAAYPSGAGMGAAYAPGAFGFAN